jgi:hypothetical protein
MVVFSSKQVSFPAMFGLTVEPQLIRKIYISLV